MKLNNTTITGPLPTELADLLTNYRRTRNFSVQSWLEVKTHLINAYFEKHGLSTAVVGVSGGVDSAVVAALLKKAQACPGSPLKEIVLLFLPVFDTAVASNQFSAQNKAQLLAESLELPLKIIDLTSHHSKLARSVNNAFSTQLDRWAAGQLVATLRMPVLYYTTSIFTAQGNPALVVGTTNRDEGAYLGYVGKTSDGMVDLQPISDLHKSEVFVLAEFLNVPSEIISATPTGDMFDARPDVEVIGATYDFIELFLGLECADPSLVSIESKEYWAAASSNLKETHRYNSHKYLVGSPSIHLDILPTDVPGGWQRQHWVQPPPCSSSVINFQSDSWAPVLNEQTPTVFDTPDIKIFKGVISPLELSSFIHKIEANTWAPTGPDGFFDKNLSVKDADSLRQSFYLPELSDELWLTLQSALPAFIAAAPYSDIPAGTVVRPRAVSHLWRLIKYTPAGRLVPHYDAPFIFDKFHTTTHSVVLFLGPSSESQTLFLQDTRQLAGFRDALPDEDFPVLHTVVLSPGDIVVFPHRLFHSSPPYQKDKTIFRTDIVSSLTFV